MSLHQKHKGKLSQQKLTKKMKNTSKRTYTKEFEKEGM
jgi:hypothetical protein